MNWVQTNERNVKFLSENPKAEHLLVILFGNSNKHLINTYHFFLLIITLYYVSYIYICLFSIYLSMWVCSSRRCLLFLWKGCSTAVLHHCGGATHQATGHLTLKLISPSWLLQKLKTLNLHLGPLFKHLWKIFCVCMQQQGVLFSAWEPKINLLKDTKVSLRGWHNNRWYFIHINLKITTYLRDMIYMSSTLINIIEVY